MDKYNKSIYPSVARTATPTAVTVDDRNVIGVQVVINITATVSTPSVVAKIDGFDPLSGAWYNLLTASAITSVGRVVLRIHPELLAAANLTAQDFLPRVYRVVMTHADTDSITYSVGINSIK